MKKTILIFMIILLCIGLFSCSGISAAVSEESKEESITESQTESVEVSKEASTDEFSHIPSFSYSEDTSAYAEGEPGVKTEGFNNVTTSSFSTTDELIELAKNEVTIEYNQTTVYYDKTEEMWLVVFSTEDVLGGCQSVYADKNGITQLIVYGE
ncbi:MAG: hypothetical protein CVU97_04820 [Firmicutes bacterium HGW-Firmicutes-21]|nr:MAG: hypothetical protein CVU97_04820 [Firmicutes bacterium HGW-Firmicutes-21]